MQLDVTNNLLAYSTPTPSIPNNTYPVYDIEKHNKEHVISSIVLFPSYIILNITVFLHTCIIVILIKRLNTILIIILVHVLSIHLTVQIYTLIITGRTLKVSEDLCVVSFNN